MEALLDKHQVADLKVLVRFVELYCSSRHRGTARTFEELPPEMAVVFRKPPVLCPECAELVCHGIQKRIKCPLDPKPSCKKCSIHCYSSEYRARVREIMAFSGRRMILRGRLDYLWHYFF
jgi:hypothetical protein